MTFLRDYKEWRKFKKDFDLGQPQSPCSKPAEFPCFVYTVVASFGYEEESALYLYESDIKEMGEIFQGALPKGVAK